MQEQHKKCSAVQWHGSAIAAWQCHSGMAVQCFSQQKRERRGRNSGSSRDGCQSGQHSVQRTACGAALGQLISSCKAVVIGDEQAMHNIVVTSTSWPSFCQLFWAYPVNLF
jgi:hypothetical protein